MSNKIIVGVHGIGDQARYETIQAIAYQFCRYYYIPTAVPMGGFHNTENDGIIERSNGSGRLFFTEAYWADIAREPEKAGYMLEETKHWAKTIVERFRAQAQEYKSQPQLQAEIGRLGAQINNMAGMVVAQDRDFYAVKRTASPIAVLNTIHNLNPLKKETVTRAVDYRMIKSVLYEAIDTVDVLEKLLFVAAKAGLFKFNLNTVLTNFMGDVQIVTEFEKERSKILGVFISTINKAYIAAKDGDAEVYIVSHSEGTVVSFLGLLKAMKEGSEKHPWLKNVKGLMTLGSPIDKHLTLWPHLWDEYVQLSCEGLKEKQIAWRNYYDKGDPVGFELDSARTWLEDTGCQVFDFTKEHDHGFYRYLMPGEAHVEYWKDNNLFDHFIGTVVSADEKNIKQPEPPNTRSVAFLSSYILPYGLVVALISLSVYVLYKPVIDFVGYQQSMTALIMNVLGITALLGGMTVASRMPRLTKEWPLRSLAFILFFLSVGAFMTLADADFVEAIGNPIRMVSVITVSSTVAIFGATSLVVALASALGGIFAGLRTRLLVTLGSILVLGVTASLVRSATSQSPLWPVLIGGTLFVYLWWLSIIFFDLVFLWHMYICNSQALRRLRDIHVKHS